MRSASVEQRPQRLKRAIGRLDRKFAIAIFTIFIMLWAVLVIIGSFFRGEGFNFILPWRQGVHEIFDL